jgi:putative spermidine/putrescine transport system ATP-binding protein
MVYVTHDQVEAMTRSDRVAVFSTGALRQVAEPRLLYEAPDSLFVARFLGESNALAATVRQRESGRCVATLTTGGTVTAVMPAAGAPGSAVHLVVRPEKILLGTAAHAAPNRFAARIAEVTFLGDQTRLRLAAFGADDFIVKLANTAGQETFAPGTEIDIGWQAEDCRALAE